jgi:Ca2+-dependent lipid-binding protein
MGLLTAEMVAQSSAAQHAPDEKHPPLLPDPYVSLELEQLDPATGEPMVDTYRTNRKHATMSPVWGAEGDTHEFRMPVWDFRETCLYMHVYDDKQLTRDTFIGEATIRTAELLQMMTTAGTRREKERLQLGRCTQPSKSQTERFTKECYGGLLSM